MLCGTRADLRRADPRPTEHPMHLPALPSLSPRRRGAALVALAAGLTAALTLAAARPAPGASASLEPAPWVDGDDHEELEEAMYGFKNHLKKLSRSLTPEARDEALEHLTEMQRIAVESKGLAPSNLDEVPEDKRAAHRDDFRKEMLAMLDELVGIEVDVLDGRFEKASERVRGPLLDIRNRSHDKFQHE